MGSRGPAPTPTDILAMRGSWLVKTRNGEPQPDRGEPDRPKLNTAERKIWKQLVENLASMQVLRRTDAWQLERYCVLFRKWRDVEKRIADETDDSLIAVLEGRSLRIHEALCKVESQFGLTPASRTRIKLESEQQDAVSASRHFRKA